MPRYVGPMSRTSKGGPGCPLDSWKPEVTVVRGFRGWVKPVSAWMKRRINGLRILNHMSFQVGLGKEEVFAGDGHGSLQSLLLVQNQNGGRFDSN